MATVRNYSPDRRHLRNPGKITLEIIDVQSGSYLGEDDIERFEDIYGRSTPDRTRRVGENHRAVIASK